MAMAPDGFSVSWEDDAKTLQSSVHLKPEVCRNFKQQATAGTSIPVYMAHSIQGHLEQGSSVQGPVQMATIMCAVFYPPIRSRNMVHEMDYSMMKSLCSSSKYSLWPFKTQPSCATAAHWCC